MTFHFVCCFRIEDYILVASWYCILSLIHLVIIYEQGSWLRHNKALVSMYTACLPYSNGNVDFIG